MVAQRLLIVTAIAIQSTLSLMGARYAQAANLESPPVTGSLRLDYFHSNNQLDDQTGFPGATLGLKFEPNLLPGWHANFDFRATQPDLIRQRTAATVSLNEGYLTWQNESWRVRAGKQIVAWGRTDGINPTDNLTPRDYVVLLPLEEDQRFGTRALTVDHAFNEAYSLALFTTPFFTPIRIPLPHDQAVFVEQRPQRKFSNSEFGLRLNRTGGQVDWSASYFHGYSLLPDVRPEGFVDTLPRLALSYAKMDVLGADVSFNLGRYGVRGEVAYHHNTHQNSDDPPDPFQKKSYFYYVIGGDRTFDDTLNINVQWFGRYVQHYRNLQDVNGTVERAVAILTASLNGQQDQFSHGFTARISKTWWNETLKGELLAILNQTRHNWYVRPLLTYDVNDHVKVSLGANFYRGGDDTFFGRLKRNQGAFAEFRYAF